VAGGGAGNEGRVFAVHRARHGTDVTLVDHRRSNLDRGGIAEAVRSLDDEGATDAAREPVERCVRDQETIPWSNFTTPRWPRSPTTFERAGWT
jgi:3-hydroxyacyl-CoA dehydrogenase